MKRSKTYNCNTHIPFHAGFYEVYLFGKWTLIYWFPDDGCFAYQLFNKMVVRLRDANLNWRGLADNPKDKK